MRNVLFLCTGNYYRSRYAEIVFNWNALRTGLAWQAGSRALDPNPANYGPMSRHTMAALRGLGIPYEPYLRFPLLAAGTDFETAEYIVAVKEKEHRPLIEQKFPTWLDRVEFWNVHDLDCAEPEKALPQLHQLVLTLANRLRFEPYRQEEKGSRQDA